MINWRSLGQIDFWLLLGAIVLAAMGLIGVYSAAGHGSSLDIFQRQLIWIGLGVVLCFFMVFFDYHFLTEHALGLYICMVLLLASVFLFGVEVNGSRSWIRIAGFGFQPSELAKIVVILALANYLTTLNKNFLTRRDFLTLAGITLCPVILVTMQGDLGTAITFVPILAGTMIVAGLKPRFLIGVLAMVLCVAPLAWFTLKDYQKQRVLVTLNPDLDPQGIGYQPRQSMIAIGSGGLTGKGFGDGLQGQLGFVPEVHNDFIFSLLGEEQGFLGATVVLTLYLLGLLRLVRIARTARDRPGILIVTGIASLIWFHVMVNVGMTMGMIPAIGIPLPLMSYGGSSTLITFLALGLALNVHRRRFVHGTARG